MNTTTLTGHEVTRTDDRGLLTIVCSGPAHSWSVTAATRADRAWAEQALAHHQGRGPAPRQARIGGCGHDLCHDEHGHSDGCLYDLGGD